MAIHEAKTKVQYSKIFDGINRLSHDGVDIWRLFYRWLINDEISTLASQRFRIRSDRIFLDSECAWYLLGSLLPVCQDGIWSLLYAERKTLMIKKNGRRSKISQSVLRASTRNLMTAIVVTFFYPHFIFRFSIFPSFLAVGTSFFSIWRMRWMIWSRNFWSCAVNVLHFTRIPMRGSLRERK